MQISDDDTYHPHHIPPQWFFSLIVIVVLTIPIVAVWSEEFRFWYSRFLRGKENQLGIRFVFALLITGMSVLILYLLYRYTRLFYE
jgi:hypothetical protein